MPYTLCVGQFLIGGGRVLGNNLDILMGKTKSFLKTLNEPVSMSIQSIEEGYRCEVFYSKKLSHVYSLDNEGNCKRRVIHEDGVGETRKTSAKNLKELCRVLEKFNISKYGFLMIFNDYSIEFRDGSCENGFYDFKECKNIKEAYNGIYLAVRSLSKSQKDGQILLQSDDNYLGVFSRYYKGCNERDKYYIQYDCTIVGKTNSPLPRKYHLQFIKMLHNICKYYSDIEVVLINLEEGTMRVTKSSGRVMEAVIKNEKVVSVKEIEKGRR